MTENRADRLASYLDEIGEDARFWERSNCLLFLARWVSKERPAYDAGRWIGACCGAISAGRLILREGGVAPLTEREAERAGLDRIAGDDATAGDIGLIDVPRARRTGALTFGCIRTPRGWCIRTHQGVAHLRIDAMRVTPHLAWKV